ncbi:MAG: hypothetical protein NTW01_04030 [Gammaproteobacteria bacterium]|nr:hypothetical protein [Gammaproteobacteria bacterium]
MLNRRIPTAWLLLALAVWGGWRAWHTRSVAVGPGALAPDPPQQTALAGDAAARFAYRNWTLTPLAAFALDARVLGREDYRFDPLASLVPTDLALGWGPMSDSAVLARIDIRQRGRFYFWTVREFPIPERDIVRSSANMHLIPADDAVADRLAEVRVGQVLRLRGKLVEARADNGLTARSSLRRDDSGAGACELVWVDALEVLQ